MTYTGHSGCVRSVYLNDDGTRLLTGSFDGTAKLWDVETGKCLMTYKGHYCNVYSAVLTPDGARVVTGSQDQSAFGIPTAADCWQHAIISMPTMKIATSIRTVLI